MPFGVMHAGSSLLISKELAKRYIMPFGAMHAGSSLLTRSQQRAKRYIMPFGAMHAGSSLWTRSQQRGFDRVSPIGTEGQHVAIHKLNAGHNSTNDDNITNVHVSTGSTPVSTASTNNSTACLNDATWQLALLSMKERKFYQRTGKKIVINGSDTAGYDKKKVECFNCHKLGHFARECKNPKSQENRSRSQDSSRRTVNVEESSSKAMLAIDDLKSKYDKLRVELTKSESDLYNYKRGLASVEEKLVFYKKNERLLCDQIVVLKRDASFNESDINGLKKQVERLKKEKEDNQFKIEKIENASKSLFAPSSIDLSNSGLEKFKEPEFEGYGVKVSDSDEDETVVLESINVQKPKQADQPRKGTGQKEVRPIWTNAIRVNQQKISNSRRNFAPTTVLTKSGLVPFIAARPFNTAVHKPFVNVAKPRTNVFQKAHSSLRRPFYQQTELKNRNLNNKVNTGKVSSVNTVKGIKMTSTVGKQRINAVKPKTYWAWRPTVKMINHVYKNTGSCVCKQFNYVDPTGRNKSVMAWVPKRN
ncbi:putative ribonuclease H-like domain-containing protein [Tanacetum coccineum]